MTFQLPFKRPKEIIGLEQVIEKRINGKIKIETGEINREFIHFKDEVKLTKDEKNKNGYNATLIFDKSNFSYSMYLHALFHLDRLTLGVPRLITENSEYGMYIDNCIEHCLLYDKLAMYDPDTYKKHKDLILSYINLESLKRFVDEDFDSIQRLQLAALMTELAYLHSVDKDSNAILAEFRISFPLIEQMRKGLVRYISVKGITTPQAKFGVVEGLWTLLGKPEDKYNTYTRFSPKNGMEIFKISEGYK